ncbi:hypothetical protein F5B19DRAFT_472550 [Rostrohypoxylon terebratum]|nr:hypothetical protein F5B19DRAFT_472550 [Rostrohypoxylon terebratum]
MSQARQHLPLSSGVNPNNPATTPSNSTGPTDHNSMLANDETVATSNSNTPEDSEIRTNAQVIVVADESLKQEQQLCAQAETKVRELESRLGNVTAKWKRTANELNKVISQTQVFKQITDEELKIMAEQLRYEISNFAHQYFSESYEVKSKKSLRKPVYERYMPRMHGLFLSEKETCPLAIKAFMWKFLQDLVFDRFQWAGDASKPMDDMWYFFDSNGAASAEESQTSLETIKKRQIWRVNTTHLILDQIRDDTRQKYLNKRKRVFIGRIRQVLDWYSSSRDHPYQDRIEDILDIAINLDKTVCLQASKVSWVLYEEPTEAMRRYENEERIVHCPSMLRRGRPNGEDFDVESMLLTKEVAILPRPALSTRQSSQPRGPGLIHLFF